MIKPDCNGHESPIQVFSTQLDAGVQEHIAHICCCGSSETVVVTILNSVCEPLISRMIRNIKGSLCGIMKGDVLSVGTDEDGTAAPGQKGSTAAEDQHSLTNRDGLDTLRSEKRII